MFKIKKHTISFRYALAGVVYTFKTQPNFKIHSLAASLALFFAWLVNLPFTETIIIIFTIGLVMVAEMVNTSIESVVDLVSPDLHPQAKIAKDVSAGMVLLSAIIAVLVAILVFGKYHNI